MGHVTVVGMFLLLLVSDSTSDHDPLHRMPGGREREREGEREKGREV